MLNNNMDHILQNALDSISTKYKLDTNEKALLTKQIKTIAPKFDEILKPILNKAINGENLSDKDWSKFMEDMLENITPFMEKMLKQDQK